MTHKTNFLIVIAGPTAVGKTDLCIKLAKKFNTSILSSDSRQFFKEMNIGTAKPTVSELMEAKHYFIDHLSIHDPYDVRIFEKETLQLLENLFKNHKCVIMTGGSGLYIDAVCQGFDEMPDIDPLIREELNRLYRTSGIESLQRLLSEVDPEYFETVDKNNPHRLIRALEVFRGTGKPFSSFREKKRVDRPFKIIKIALYRDRAELYARIDMRMDQMIAQGLFEEARELFAFKDLNALQTVGYKEIFDFIEGRYDLEEAIRLLKRNSRRYAKRQMTWFRRDESYVWFHPSQNDQIIGFIADQIG
ncbi:tRNA (adenosine(37)-N6)-dimethylallyltransferase MiaA [Anditalea andensis]|uniref:tRNA dimethylallyltransferase n=1 Tax=Anditalea andensis TaxID=1048983 RepID=A0A074KVT0_9BACT|nr:tRNA delta(2)-isopentenylpyrophosphate transferase [Anditalea andensis]